MPQTSTKYITIFAPCFFERGEGILGKLTSNLNFCENPIGLVKISSFAIKTENIFNSSLICVCLRNTPLSDLSSYGMVYSSDVQRISAQESLGIFLHVTK